MIPSIQIYKARVIDENETSVCYEFTHPKTLEIKVIWVPRDKISRGYAPASVVAKGETGLVYLTYRFGRDNNLLDYGREDWIEED